MNSTFLILFLDKEALVHRRQIPARTRRTSAVIRGFVAPGMWLCGYSFCGYTAGWVIPAHQERVDYNRTMTRESKEILPVAKLPAEKLPAEELAGVPGLEP